MCERRRFSHRRHNIDSDSMLNYIAIVFANGGIYTHPEIGLKAADWLTINRSDVEAGDWMI